MNNISNSPTTFENFQKCACQIASQCYSCFSCARRRRIHPDRTGNPNHSKIIRFQPNRLIRVIHLKNFAQKKPNLLDSPLYFSDESDENRRTFSFSDSDYAFTSWSKPLRLCDECRRSFKNLWQESVSQSGIARQYGDELKDDLNHESCDSASQAHRRNSKCSSTIEQFVDAFVKDVLNDAILSICTKTMLERSVSCNSRNNVRLSVNDCNKCDIEKFEQCRFEGDIKIKMNHDNALESGFRQRQNNLLSKSCPESKMNGISLNYREDHKPKSNEEMFTYYNSSYDAGEEANATQLKLRENNGIAQNQNFSICTHLKNKTSKPILLFLHGVGCSADLWSHLLNFFGEDGYEVVAPDMLGHGYSSTPDCPSAYTFHYLLKDALEVFDKFVGEMKCVVIGHAFGCSLAAALARYRPQQVTQLVLISGGGPTPLAPRRADFRPPSVSPWLQMCLKPLLLCGLKREILYVPCGKHIETADSINSGVPSYVLHHIARGQDWPEGDSAFHRRILVPTLLVHGMKDPYVTLVQECEMERTIPRSSLELIANAGHFAMVETPEKLCHMIQCFINWWYL